MEKENNNNNIKSNNSFFNHENKEENNLENYKGKWYVINCYSGQEERVKNDLIQRIESLLMKDIVFDICIVKENVYLKNSKKNVEKNIFPGYIFINMIMNDEAWYVVRNTTGVTGFIGSSGRGVKPFPLTDQEARNMLNKIISIKNRTKKNKKIYTASFIINDYVKILSGPFKNIIGQVIKMDFSKGIVIINIEIFGRLTPTEFSFDQCEKIN